NRRTVAPRRTAIDQSTWAEETNANWSSGLTIWDRLHGTLRLNVPQDEVIVGVPAFRDPQSVTLPKALALPLQPPRDFWRLPDGRIPAPHLGLVPPNYLLP